MAQFSRRVPSRFPPAASTTVRAGKRRRVTTAAKADAALRLARKLVRQVEVKVGGVVQANTDMVGTTSVFSANTIATGDGDGQRTGLSITAKRLDLKFRMASFTQSNLTWRVLVVQDRQTAAAAPGYADVVNGTTTLGAYNPVNIDRFKILADKTFTQNANFVGEDMTVALNLSLKNFLDGGEIRFSGTGGANYDRNALWVMVSADYGAVGNVVTQGLAAGDAQYQCLGSLYFADA